MKRDGVSLAFSALNTCILTLLVIVTAYPMLYVLFASVSEPSLLMQHRGPLFMPLGFSTGAYKLVFKNPMVPTGYLNTLFYVVTTTAQCLVLTTVMAYVLSRENLYWRNSLMFMITFTMFFSGGMIPTFIVVKQLGIYNTRWAVIIPGAINTYNLIVMRTSMQAMPKGLDESAKIDGANHITILLRIVIPLSMPVIAVMTLYYGVASWNGWFQASIYLRKRELFPLQLIIREILLESDASDMMTELNSVDRNVNYTQLIKYAIVVVSSAPILCVYPFLQRFFVKGVMIGAIKG